MTRATTLGALILALASASCSVPSRRAVPPCGWETWEGEALECKALCADGEGPCGSPSCIARPYLRFAVGGLEEGFILRSAGEARLIQLPQSGRGWQLGNGEIRFGPDACPRKGSVPFRCSDSSLHIGGALWFPSDAVEAAL